MQVCCPVCDTTFPIAAGFAEADGKRLAALLAEFEPVLGRATIAYLALFKPAKTALRMSRAGRLVADLKQLVDVGDVCRDERAGVRRPATPAMWAAGMELMLQQRASLTLPLDGHNYLRAVVFGLADKADAEAERAREQDLQRGRRPTSHAAPQASRLQTELDTINHDQHTLGVIDAEEADLRRRRAHERYGGER